MQTTSDEIRVTTDLAAMDIDFIERMLHSTYWAKDRSRAAIEASLKASLCFGAFVGSKQIGFARVVTDRATFAWLCDVVVDPEYRGKGVAKMLVKSVVEHPDLATTKMVLGTKDAHGLYEKFGFYRRELMFRKAVQ